MGVATLRWVRRQKIKDETLSAVLLALADAAETTGTCDLSQDAIAKRSGLKERACRNALSMLSALGVIRRQRRGRAAEGGRLPDLITFPLEQQFEIDRETIRMCRKGSEYNRHQDAGKVAGISGTVPVIPESKNDGGPYIARARASSANVGGLISPAGARGSVWLEKASGQWRARLHYEGLTLELGRHECRELAEAECRVHFADIEHASSTKTGTPREPKINPDLESLQGEALCDFLFGKDEEMGRPTGREAERHGVRGQGPGQGFGGGSPHVPKEAAASARAGGRR